MHFKLVHSTVCLGQCLTTRDPINSCVPFNTVTIWIPNTWNPMIWLFRHFFIRLVFKWSDQVIRQTIQIPYILDHKTDIFCLATIWNPDHAIIGHVWTIQIPDLSGIQMVNVPLRIARFSRTYGWKYSLRVVCYK